MRALRYLVIALLLAGFWLHLEAVSQDAVSSANSDTISYVSSDNSYVNKTESPSYASPLEAAYSSNDSYLSQRWGISRIEAPQAGHIAKGGQPIIVAVLDTGIDKHSRGLADKLVAEVNFTDSPTSDDLYGHGTHMAGTIAAIAPECQLMNVKVADDTGRCQTSVVAKGIIWAVDHGADVINISLCMKSSPDLEEAVNYAWRQGVVIVAAAGNEGKSTPVYPAYYANCLAVAATDESDSLALLSGHGDWVDVAAPGFNIYSELPHNQYGYKSGTSSAVAHVSGVAALVFSVAEDANGNDLINDEVRQAIEDACYPINAEGMGKGRVSALEAITRVISLS